MLRHISLGELGERGVGLIRVVVDAVAFKQVEQMAARSLPGHFRGPRRTMAPNGLKLLFAAPAILKDIDRGCPLPADPKAFNGVVPSRLTRVQP